jgi:hypothetical protein
MRPHVLTFVKPPSLNELVARVRAVMNVGCELRLHERYDMGSNRPIYVILPLGFKDEWQSGLKGAEVVTEIALLSVGEINVHETSVMTEKTIVDSITVEHPSQEEWQCITHRVSLDSELVKINSEALNLTVVTDEFDADTFAENVDTKQHIEEDDETTRSENDEENRQPSVDTAPDATVGPGGEGNEANVPSSAVTLYDVLTSNHIHITKTKSWGYWSWSI